MSATTNAADLLRDFTERAKLLGFDSDTRVGVEEAAFIAQVSHQTIRNYLKAGTLPCIRKGGRRKQLITLRDLAKACA